MKHTPFYFVRFYKEGKNRLFIGLLTLIMSLTTINTYSQDHTISGVVTDLDTGETLIGVNVLIPELRAGVITNAYGFYSITLPEGTHELI